MVIMAVMAITDILPFLTSLDGLKGLESWPRRWLQLCVVRTEWWSDGVTEWPVYHVCLEMLSHLKTVKVWTSVSTIGRWVTSQPYFFLFSKKVWTKNVEVSRSDTDIHTYKSMQYAKYGESRDLFLQFGKYFFIF